jgi:hypothetical protein
MAVANLLDHLLGNQPKIMSRNELRLKTPNWHADCFHTWHRGCLDSQRLTVGPWHREIRVVNFLSTLPLNYWKEAYYAACYSQQLDPGSRVW